jgi:hypothetical protein
VQLKTTTRTSSLIETYDHFMGWAGGERAYEKWAKVKAEDGAIAFWKLQQLEEVLG